MDAEDLSLYVSVFSHHFCVNMTLHLGVGKPGMVLYKRACHCLGGSI
jgi:hypothetical protein